MPPNNAPTVARVGQAPGNATKGVDVILLGDLNVRPREPHDVQEEELVTVVADCGLEDTTAHFMPRIMDMADENRGLTGDGAGELHPQHYQTHIFKCRG